MITLQKGSRKLKIGIRIVKKTRKRLLIQKFTA